MSKNQLNVDANAYKPNWTSIADARVENTDTALRLAKTTCECVDAPKMAIAEVSDYWSLPNLIAGEAICFVCFCQFLVRLSERTAREEVAEELDHTVKLLQKGVALEREI
jgi:hypothetical protein